MDERSYRRAAAPENNESRLGGSLASRPDRVALWAVVMSVIAMLAGVASAEAGSSGGASAEGGGAGAPESDPATGAAGCMNASFGSRPLALGDCGDDVRTLNWILKSRSYAAGVSLAQSFESPTDQSVREFERRARLSVDGVVEAETRDALVRSMPRQRATWYGPGFRGNRTACGQRLERSTVGVAHKTLPCGSRVVVRYRGRFLRTRVIDRGPYANGAKWDLTEAAAERVGLETTADIRVAKIPKR